MANVVIVGAQWGDEGKGKIVDVLMQDLDWVVRYQGGSNAGHTVEIGAQRYALHLIPSGILRPDKTCVIGNGVVVDPQELVDEIARLAGAGIGVRGRLFVSDRAHMSLPCHKAVDAGSESRRRTGDKLGTTLRGIGPTYADKAARTGLRMGFLAGPNLAARLRARLEADLETLAAQGLPTFDLEASFAELCGAAEILRPHIVDTVPLLHRAMAEGKNILFEGAQGTMLDLDFGTYPFVTSSNSTAGGAATGTGVPPRRLDRVIGVIKAYTTRVGAGPFPTELNDDLGERLRQRGREFGTTTGRPRRCGWFDGVVARYSAMVNGIDEWALTKLDVLDGLPEIRIATSYRLDGRSMDTPPADAAAFARCEPVCESVPGWSAPTADVSRFEDLPEAARRYVRRLETLTGVPVRMLSVGPRRDRTIAVPAA
jgi:adenylosuccinate synthase